MNKPRISFFVHNLSDNPIVRAAALAQALQPRYEVEILGFVASPAGVYEPYRGLFEYKTITCPDHIGAVWKNIPRLAALAGGDVIYACKPLLTSFGPALSASRRRGRKALLLDVEDDEWAASGKGPGEFIWRYLIKGWRHATSWKYTRLLHSFTHNADGVTVVSRKLQRRYGGTLVRNGPDENKFLPSAYRQETVAALKSEFCLPDQRRLALFAGVPRPHKGWDTLLAALTRPECGDWDLVLAGDRAGADFALAEKHLGKRCHLIGTVPQARMADLLACVDALPVPQKRLPFTESQVPAKMLEGMALAKPVIASRVGDLPEILGDNERGWLIEPDDAVGLAQAFRDIADHPEVANERARAAREWFLREASHSVIRAKLEPMIEAALAHHRH